MYIYTDMLPGRAIFTTIVYMYIVHVYGNDIITMLYLALNSNLSVSLLLLLCG